MNRKHPPSVRASMTWAQRLKRVFNIDIETCQGCGGAMKVMACIEDPVVVTKILDHIGVTPTIDASPHPEPRAPPPVGMPAGLFD